MDQYLIQEKSAASAQSLRGKGNIQFSLKNYASSVKLYTDSILCCPSDDTNEMSIAYANRSASLFQLELYEDCIADIDIAINHRYPAHLLPKILIRKMKSLNILRKTEDLKTVFVELDSAMKNLQLTEMKTSKMITLISKIFPFMCQYYFQRNCNQKSKVCSTDAQICAKDPTRKM